METLRFKEEQKLERFVTEVNKKRLALKREGGDQCFTVLANVEGKAVRLKIFETSILTFKVDGLDFGSSYDLKARVFVNELLRIGTRV